MKVKSLIPNVMVRDIHKSAKFYTDVLGFTFDMAVADQKDGPDMTLDAGKQYVWGKVSCEGAEIMFQTSESISNEISGFSMKDPVSSILLYMHVDDIEAYHKHCQDKGADIIEGIKETWYGMREIILRDPDGYVLYLGEPMADGKA